MLCISSVVANAQTNFLDTMQHEPDMVKPNILTTHPLGLLFMRIDHNLQTKSPDGLTISLDLGAGNVWLAPVKTYLPKDEATIAHLSSFPWHKRDSVYQLMTQNHDSIFFTADAVLRPIFLKASLPLSQQWSIDFVLRSFLVTTGNMPVSFITNDAVIEAFHSHIAGGQNPFARKQYGFNKAILQFQDANGKSIRKKNGDLVVGGVQTSIYYFAKNNWLTKNNMGFNTGVHVGINTTTYVPAMDVGVSVAASKKMKISAKRNLLVAASGSVTKHHLISWGNVLQFSNRNFLPAFECAMEYRKTLSKSRFRSLGLNFYQQSALNNPTDFNKITLAGNRYTTHWHMAMTHMYRNTQNWTLSYAYFHKILFCVYIKEDFKVDNAPDIQTGFSLQIPLSQRR